MNTLQKTILTGSAVGAILLQAALPAFAATTLTISGNGADTTNNASIKVTKNTTVVQTNTSDVNNTINTKANTGKNEAEKNTGGDVAIKTGDADTSVTVQNDLNRNAADVNNCCGQDASVEISGNGADSNNTANLGVSKNTVLYQTNNADVNNTVNADASSGENTAEKNTGGDVSIDTGDAKVETTVQTAANSNVATNGGGQGNGGSISARIVDNGADTTNSITLGMNRGALVKQTNEANVSNDVKAQAQTGKNEAEDNTNGDASIKTGDADITILVDNLLNFNSANVDCGCLLDVDAKVGGNGVESYNKINATLADDASTFQTNDDDTKNFVDPESSSGENKIEESTMGDPLGDPNVDTGDAATTVEVYNTNNTNQAGNLSIPAFPWGGQNVSITFDLTAFLQALLG